MKLFVCSDIHGNARALGAVMELYRKLGPSEFLFLGDCVGYGAHPDTCLDVILNIPGARIILGNHDSALLHEAERADLNEIAAEALGWSEALLDGSYDEAIRGRFAMMHEESRYLAVHASPYRPEDWVYVFSALEAEQAFFARAFRLCFLGHTHTPVAYEFGAGEAALREGVPLELAPGKRYIVNPGSVGQPRDGDPRASCCLFDADAGTITLHRCEYDIEAEARDIVDAGLPAYLGERLLYGT